MGWYRWVNYVAGLACCMLIGCSHTLRTQPPPPPQTRVEYQAVAANAQTPRYELQPGESATKPKLIERLAPTYPIAQIPAHLAHVSVRARIVVDTQGKVADVRIMPAGAAYPVAFDQAVRDAASKWRYTPLQFLRWRETYNAQGILTGSQQVAVETKPFSLDYEFHFDLRDGKPVVASTRATEK